MVEMRIGQGASGLLPPAQPLLWRPHWPGNWLLPSKASFFSGAQGLSLILLGSSWVKDANASLWIFPCTGNSAWRIPHTWLAWLPPTLAQPRHSGQLFHLCHLPGSNTGFYVKHKGPRQVLGLEPRARWVVRKVPS
jgi:hypothetical protein